MSLFDMEVELEVELNAVNCLHACVRPHEHHLLELSVLSLELTLLFGEVLKVLSLVEDHEGDIPASLLQLPDPLVAARLVLIADQVHLSQSVLLPLRVLVVSLCCLYLGFQVDVLPLLCI